jgi:glucan 1,3-beta-glucosidase
MLSRHSIRLFAAYFKEGCYGDPGWCFKAAVGTSLPSTFWSYPQRHMDDSQLQSILDTIADTDPPPPSDVLAKFQQNAAAASFLSAQLHASPSDGVPRTHDLHHRFEAIHLRQLMQDPFEQRDLTSTQRSILQGYADGFATGKMFAVKGKLSKVGFVGQYMFDNIALLGPSVVAPGTEAVYRKAFVRGLGDVEEIVKSVLHDRA